MRHIPFIEECVQMTLLWICTNMDHQILNKLVEIHEILFAPAVAENMTWNEQLCVKLTTFAKQKPFH